MLVGQNPLARKFEYVCGGCDRETRREPAGDNAVREASAIKDALSNTYIDCLVGCVVSVVLQM